MTWRVGFFPKWSVLAIGFLLLAGCPGLQPTTKPANMEKVLKDEYAGPKAKLTLTRFQDKSARGEYSSQMGGAMTEMLANTLSSTHRYLILERSSLKEPAREQDPGVSGRSKTETVPKIGEIDGAELLVEGTVTEFEPGPSGTGGTASGSSGTAGFMGGIFGKGKNSHVAMTVNVIDVRTGRRLASEQVEGRAADIEGIGGMAGGGLPGGLGVYSNTPMEKAIRTAIEEAARLIVVKTPPEYYRFVPKASPRAVVTPQPKAPDSPKTAPPAAVPAPHPPPTAPVPVVRVTQVAWATVNLREGPGMNFKVLGNAKKGVTLGILTEKAGWLLVRLEDGSEAWVSKAATSEAPAPKTAPPAPPTSLKPKPM